MVIFSKTLPIIILTLEGVTPPQPARPPSLGERWRKEHKGFIEDETTIAGDWYHTLARFTLTPIGFVCVEGM